MAASSPLIDGRKITDLRVADLKLELEHRGIESKGLKADLVKRLEKVRENGGTGTMQHEVNAF